MFPYSARRRISMTDSLQLGIFAAVLIAFVVTGCLVTRVPKKPPNTGPVKHCSAGEGWTD
jgi:hypothetical protein